MKVHTVDSLSSVCAVLNRFIILISNIIVFALGFQGGVFSRFQRLCNMHV